MAGTIIADYIRADANKISLNVGNTTFATINASGFFSNTGTQLIAANGAISGASVIAGSITNAKLSLSANDSNIKTALNASGSPGIFAARAWVNWNGTGTVAIRGSGGISSITDNGTGNYSLNFSSAMPDANYAVVATVSESGVGGASRAIGGDGYTTSAALVLTYSTGTLTDYAFIQAAIFR
jgi:hypothetical protein